MPGTGPQVGTNQLFNTMRKITVSLGLRGLQTEIEGSELVRGRAGMKPQSVGTRGPASTHQMAPFEPLELSVLWWGEQGELGSKTQTRHSDSHISSQSARVSASVCRLPLLGYNLGVFFAKFLKENKLTPPPPLKA